jgi:hypothetical protein
MDAEECKRAVEAPFRDRALNSRPELYLDRTTAIALMSHCDALNAAVVRVEAFLLEAGQLLQSTELISDYPEFQNSGASWSGYRKECNDFARSFIYDVTRPSELTGTSDANDTRPPSDPFAFTFVVVCAPQSA